MITAVNHKPTCRYFGAQLLYWKLDPTCPRCYIKLTTGKWPPTT